MREIFRSDYFIITVDDARKLVRGQRTDVPYASLEHVERAQLALLDATGGLYRPAYVLLIDVRLAPPRNDPSFEEVVIRYQDRLHGGYRKTAALAKFEVGRLQILRMTTEAAAPRFRVFTDEQAALDYLLGPA